LKLVEIPAGSFLMGSPGSETGRDNDEAQHRVKITRAYLMSATEVTQAQWEQVMGGNPSARKGADLPVEKVTWYDAVSFCNKLSAKEGLRPAYRISGKDVTWDESADGYRLPTEAEWEYACRAGTTTAYNTGSDEAALERAGWYSGNSGGDTTHPVGQKAANAWGLHDMHGNVWEWCWDWFGDYGEVGNSDPHGPSSGSYRVLRGGSGINDAGPCRTANRYRNDASSVFGHLGFRVVRNSAR